MSIHAERIRDPLLTVDQAADYLGVSAYTMRLWARERKVPAIQLGRYWRFRESSLATWVDDQERRSR